MVEVFAIKLNMKNRGLTLEELYSYISKEKIKKIRKYKKVEDIYRSAIGEALIRMIIIRKFGLNNKEINFSFNKYGKPFIKKISNFYFNISHSGEWVVCGIGKTPLGIDIEKIDQLDINIAKHFFSKQEYNDIYHKKNDRLEYFYSIWTLKESYIKALGKGLHIPLNSFTIKINHNND